MYTIYFLSEITKTEHIFYVGRTSLSLKERLSCHLSESKIKIHKPKNKKILEIIKKGGTVIITQAETTYSYNKSFLLERKYTKLFLSKGHVLLNNNSCGKNNSKKRPRKVFLVKKVST